MVQGFGMGGVGGVSGLGGSYTYYKRLLTDSNDFSTGSQSELYAKLYNASTSALNTTLGTGSNTQAISNYFQTMASAELQKERALLREIFGIDIVGKYGDTNFAEDLITSINEILGIKEVFLRNLQIIRNTNGTKNILTWFPKYFYDEWQKTTQPLVDKAREDFFKTSNTNIIDILVKKVNEKIPLMVRKALVYMFEKADVENGVDEKYKDAYKVLAEHLRIKPDEYSLFGKNKTSGLTKYDQVFVDSFIETYHLKDIVEGIANNFAITGLSNTKNPKKAINKKSSLYNINFNVHQYGGLTMENVRQWYNNYIGTVGMARLNQNRASDVKLKSSSFRSGKYAFAADNIMYAGVDYNFDFDEWINRYGEDVQKVGSGKNATSEAIYEMEKALRNFNDGFIIYSNAKNYTINSAFSKKGFSAGTAITLESYKEIAANLYMGASEIIRACMQLPIGAIGDGRKEEISTMLARMIASRLFDDVNVVGKVERGGARSIHLLDLNGILIPLSFYFQQLANAFGQYSIDEVKNLVQVEISGIKSILWPKEGDFTYDGQGSGAAWHKQADDTLKSIKIGYYFYAGFKQEMSKLNINFE